MLRTLTLAVAVALAVSFAPAAHAQSLPPPPPPTLDAQVESLLQNNCAGLFSSAGLAFGTPVFGPNLSAICNGPSGTGSSSGGGAASPQASTLSIQKSLLQRRLERAKKNQKDDDEESSVVSGLARGRSGKAGRERSDASDDSGTTGSSRRFDIFASGAYESLDRNLTPFEDGYDSSILAAAVGADYRFNDAVVAGLIAGYRKHDGDFDGGGNFKMTSFEPSVFVSVLPSQRTFLQFVAGYGGQNSDVNRSVHFDIDSGGTPTSFNGTAASAADAKAYNAGAQFGYDWAAGRFTFGPRLGVNYSRTTIDPYSESGGTGLELRVDKRKVKSLQSVAGFYGSAAISTKGGVFLPQFNVEYIHEFEDDPSIVSAQFFEDLRGPTATTFTYQTNAPDSDFFNIEAGAAGVLARGIQLFGNIRAMVGNEHFDNIAGTIGVRFEL